MKKIICFIMMCFMCVSITACGGNDKVQPAEFDSTVEIDGFEMIVSDDILVADSLNGDKDRAEEFLTTQKTYANDTILCDVILATEKGYIYGVIDYSLKNISKSEEEFDVPVQLSYDDGYIYDASELHYIMGGALHDWKEFTSLILDPLQSVQCKALFCVPEEVFLNNEAPLKLIIDNYEYTIR